MTRLIAPSILSADFSILGEEVESIAEAGADIIHIDVMDGHFVQNITMGPDIVKAVRKHTNLPLDVHLMIENPEQHIEKFAGAGADMMSVHFEACDLEKVLPAIRRLKCKAGAVINPPTSVDKFLTYVEYADFVLVMTVNPGFGGQQLIPDCVEKIKRLKKYIAEERRLKILIEVDGGIGTSNVKTVTDAGADIIVAGSAIFGHKQKNYVKVIKELKTC